jgi:hypothetical protein
MRRSILAFVGAMVLIGAINATAQSDQRNQKHGDPDDLAARWWQYVSSIPAAGSPFYDETKCGVGQQGDIWNLVSTAPHTETLGDPTELHCTIPTRTKIFVQLFSQFCIAFPGETQQEQPGFCATGLDAPILLRLVIDGKERGRLIDRRTSGWFTMHIADDDVYPGLPGGFYRSVADGYYALLPPLEPGDHEVLYQAGVEQEGQTVFFNTRHILHIVKPAKEIVPVDPTATSEP